MYRTAAPEINISPVPDIVSDSQRFVPVTCNLCRSSLYDILLKFENLPVIVTGRKRMLSVTHEFVPDSDRWPAVISCTDLIGILFYSLWRYISIIIVSWYEKKNTIRVWFDFIEDNKYNGNLTCASFLKCGGNGEQKYLSLRSKHWKMEISELQFS